MCTVMLLWRPEADWPLILGGNRDEMASRAWLPPDRHWPDRPNVVAGLDLTGGGSWVGLNDEGVFAAMLNRQGSLGPAPDKRSRGELVLEALDHADAEQAAAALADLNPDAYRPFNMILADNRDAFWLRHRDDSRDPIEVFPLPPGASIVTAHDRNDPGSARIRTYLPRFRTLPEPDPLAPGEEGWKAWESLLSSRLYESDDDPTAAMTVVTGTGFGTVSSALIALPAARFPERKPVFRFAPGRPDITPFEDVSLA